MNVLYLFIFSLSIPLLFFSLKNWIVFERKRYFKALSSRLPALFHNDEFILDVGSGTGFFAEMMKNNIPGQIYCLDIHHYHNSDSTFLVADANYLPFADCSFDSVTLFYVLHHSHCPQDVLLEAHRVCRKRVLVQEDVYSNLFERIMFQFHIWSFSRLYQLSGTKAMTDNEWIQLFDKTHMTIEQKIHIKRIGYPVSRREYILTPNNTKG